LPVSGASSRVRSIDLENPFAPLVGMCEFLMVRHGEQVLTRETSVDRSLDPPLSELGQRQVQAVAARLRETHIDAIYSSPLRRAFDTGAAIGGYHGITPQRVEALQEFHPWLGLQADRSVHDILPPGEVKGIFRDLVRTKRYDAFPYGEDRHEFRRRINLALSEIIDRHPGQRVVVTCHSGVINALLAWTVQTDQDMPVRVHHTSISVFRGADTRRAVISVNDYTHVLPFQTAVDPFNL
jgi:probable phosphoglycerate mutase